MNDRIAQQMLERRQHALDHLTVELSLGPFDRKLGRSARIGAGLAYDSRQARHVALERHHARLHEAVLDARRHARLLGQQRAGLIREPTQQIVETRNVVRGLRERSGKLLDLRVTIELEWIEVAARLRVVLMRV